MSTWAEPEVAARHAATNIPTSRSGFTSSAFITLRQFKNVDECIRKSGKYHEYISVLVGSDYLSQATEEKAENARLSSFVGALALGDLVKSTLGPKGMNKILQSGSTGEINVTNDGATILKAIQLDNAAAKILVNISKVQDDEVGDGTTSVCVLAAELLREAEKLIAQKIHPQTIVEGYRIASLAALKALEGAAVDHAYVASFIDQIAMC